MHDDLPDADRDAPLPVDAVSQHLVVDARWAVNRYGLMAPRALQSVSHSDYPQPKACQSHHSRARQTRALRVPRRDELWTRVVPFHSGLWMKITSWFGPLLADVTRRKGRRAAWCRVAASR